MENSGFSVFLLLLVQVFVIGVRSENGVRIGKTDGEGCEMPNRGKHYLSDVFIWPNPRLNDSECERDMDLVQREAGLLNMWALKMLDASAKPPSGIISGNLNQFGDFDECLSVRGGPQDHPVKGKYCLASVDVKVTDDRNGNWKIQALDEAIHSHRMITNHILDEGHRIPKFETFVWGVCIPSSCRDKEVEAMLSFHLRKMSKGSRLSFGVAVNEEMCYVKEEKETTAIKRFVMLVPVASRCLFSLIVVLAIADLIVDVNKLKLAGHPKAAAILKCFSVKKNWQSLWTIHSSDDDIECLHGARFLNAVALLLSHKQIAMFYAPTHNRTAMSEAFSKSWTMVGRSAILYTDSFIMISGILASYSFVKSLDRRKSLEFKDKLISRVIRFTPGLLGVILFYTYLMEDLNSGPHWGLVVGKYASLCKKNMWRNLLYIHNYFGFENMCLTHTHQLGIDMQLFLVSPILVYALWKSPILGSAVLVGMSSASTWLRYEVTRRENLSTNIYYGISVEQLWKTANLSYILPTHRLTVYAAGILAGYYLRRSGRRLRLNRTSATLGWILAVSAALLAVFGPYKSALKGYVYDPVFAARFNAFAPILWTFFIAWGLFACVNGYGGFFNAFLSWKYFRIFTKISYAIYLTQFPVFFYGIGTTRTAQVYNGFHSMFDIPELFVILVASVTLTLAFEIPCQELKKVLFERHKSSEKGETNATVDEITGNRSKGHNTRGRLNFYGT